MHVKGFGCFGINLIAAKKKLKTHKLRLSLMLLNEDSSVALYCKYVANLKVNRLLQKKLNICSTTGVLYFIQHFISEYCGVLLVHTTQIKLSKLIRMDMIYWRRYRSIFHFHFLRYRVLYTVEMIFFLFLKTNV